VKRSYKANIKGKRYIDYNDNSVESGVGGNMDY
jgi:hypothetical protein